MIYISRLAVAAVVYLVLGCGFVLCGDWEGVTYKDCKSGAQHSIGKSGSMGGKPAHQILVNGKFYTWVNDSVLLDTLRASAACSGLEFDPKNPLAHMDSNGDGVPDLTAYLAGCDAFAVDCNPWDNYRADLAACQAGDDAACQRVIDSPLHDIDSDGDGFSDAEELTAGTDPSDPYSFPDRKATECEGVEGQPPDRCRQVPDPDFPPWFDYPPDVDPYEPPWGPGDPGGGDPGGGDPGGGDPGGGDPGGGNPGGGDPGGGDPGGGDDPGDKPRTCEQICEGVTGSAYESCVKGCKNNWAWDVNNDPFVTVFNYLMGLLISKVDRQLAVEEQIQKKIDELAKKDDTEFSFELVSELKEQQAATVGALKDIKESIEKGTGEGIDKSVAKLDEISQKLGSEGPIAKELGELSKDMKGIAELKTSVDALEKAVRDGNAEGKADAAALKDALESGNGEVVTAVRQVRDRMDEMSDRLHADNQSAASLLTDIKTEIGKLAPTVNVGIDVSGLEGKLDILHGDNINAQTSLSATRTALNERAAELASVLREIKGEFAKVDQGAADIIEGLGRKMDVLAGKPDVKLDEVERLLFEVHGVLNGMASRPGTDVSKIESLLEDIKEKTGEGVSVSVSIDKGAFKATEDKLAEIGDKVGEIADRVGKGEGDKAPAWGGFGDGDLWGGAEKGEGMKIGEKGKGLKDRIRGALEGAGLSFDRLKNYSPKDFQGRVQLPAGGRLDGIQYHNFDFSLTRFTPESQDWMDKAREFTRAILTGLMSFYFLVRVWRLF